MSATEQEVQQACRDSRLFEPDQAAEITRLYPVRTTPRLVGHFSER